MVPSAGSDATLRPRHGGQRRDDAGLPGLGGRLFPQDRADLRGPDLMTAEVVIQAQGLGKKYRIGHQADRERYVALRDVIARNARSMVRSAADLVSGRQVVAGDEIEDFWALRDLDFQIRRGEVVGIIGRNG